MVIEIGFGIVCIALIICCVMFKSERDVARCQRDLAMHVSEEMSSRFGRRLRILEKKTEMVLEEETSG